MTLSVLDRLKRRKLVQWLVAYLAGAWLLLQVLALLSEPFHLPDGVLRFSAVLLGIGFFAAVVLAWYHGEKGAQRVSGAELVLITVILMGAAAGASFMGRGIDPNARHSIEPVLAVAERGSIAVLPFADMSAGHDQEYFSDGLTEELLNVLSQVPQLRVAARTSAFSFKGKQVPVDSIGRALHVEHLIEGSVRRSGNRLRITAQLVNARTGYHLWSKTYDRELRDLFAVQDEIARAILGRLELHAPPELAGGALRGAETTDPDVYAMMLRARVARRTATPDGIAQALALLREAVQRDPQYGKAHAELASTLWLGAYFRYVPHIASFRQAQREADRALALDSSLAVAHDVLGRIAAYTDWNWQTAEQHFRAALDYNPNDATTHSDLAWLLAWLGRTDEAMAESQRAGDLDPLAPGLHSNHGAMHIFARQWREGVREMEAALALSPQSPVVLSNLASAYSGLGRHADALRTARQALALSPKNELAAATLACVAAAAGQRAEAERVLRELESWPNGSPYLKATVYASLDQRDRAFLLLNQAVDRRDDFAPSLGIDPSLDKLRSDPRMQRLLRKAHLPTGTQM